MCRLLLVKSDKLLEAETHLKKFALIAKQSKEYQGHGWGCSLLENDKWKHYKSIKPIWEDDLSRFGNANVLVAHARSAFRDEGIAVENNMPFHDNKHVFIFNGELRGVKINSEGRIGAEKIFNFIKRFDKGDMQEAIRKAVEIIKKRTSYIRAMNFVIADSENVYAYSLFNEDQDYFTMRYSEEEHLIICSEEILDKRGMKLFPNDTLMKFK
jgi:predicted glutamine amidotransferase